MGKIKIRPIDIWVEEVDAEEGENTERFSVFIPQLPGCVSCGDTEEEAMRMIIEALGLLLDSYHDDSVSVPWVEGRCETVGASQ